MFEEKGIVLAETALKQSETEILEIATDHAIESGAEDVKMIDETNLEFICGASSLKKVAQDLENKFNYKITSASVEYIPLKLQELTDQDLELSSSLYEKLENLPEVVRISDNIA